MQIGLLFQIVDDLIDFKGNARLVGKKTKKDIKKGKATLINLNGYLKSIHFAHYLKNNIKIKLKKYGLRSKNLIESLDLILLKIK